MKKLGTDPSVAGIRGILGRTIERVQRPVAVVDSEPCELSDSIILSVRGGEHFQIICEPDKTWVRAMGSADDILLFGDFKECPTSLTPVCQQLVPLRVQCVATVLEKSDSGSFAIGVLLLDGPIGIGIVTDTDDLLVGDITSFWEYMMRVLPDRRSLLIVPVVPETR